MKTLHWFALVALLVLAGCAPQARPTRIIIQEPRARNPVVQATPVNPLPKLPEEPAIPAVPVTVAPLPSSSANTQATPENQVPSTTENPAMPATAAPSPAASPFANAMTESKAKVKVLGVFFVPSDMPNPTDQEIRDFQKHLVVAQTNYKKMLLGRDTFTLNSKSPFIYHSSNPLAYFQNYPTDSENAKFIVELLKALNVDRNSLTDDLAVVVMNPKYDWPRGAGRPLNGGIDKGAGVLAVSSNRLDSPSEDFQGTLEHELGHTFGLVHTDTYGYSQDTGDSIMSYNHDHRWTGFTPPAHPGILIPEDIRSLAENKNVFPTLFFDPKTDVPAGYDLKPIKTLGPADLNTEVPGYVLTINKKVVKNETNYGLDQALTDLWKAIQDNPHKVVQATYQGGKLVISGKGYELYASSGKRIGTQPDWTYDHAMTNLLGNIKKDPEVPMVGLFNGQVMPTN
jgi:Metallo-peptidase family M12B Reprolysin-like